MLQIWNTNFAKEITTWEICYKVSNIIVCLQPIFAQSAETLSMIISSDVISLHLHTWIPPIFFSQGFFYFFPLFTARTCCVFSLLHNVKTWDCDSICGRKYRFSVRFNFTFYDGWNMIEISLRCDGQPVNWFWNYLDIWKNIKFVEKKFVESGIFPCQWRLQLIYESAFVIWDFHHQLFS